MFKRWQNHRGDFWGRNGIIRRIFFDICKFFDSLPWLPLCVIMQVRGEHEGSDRREDSREDNPGNREILENDKCRFIEDAHLC